MNTRVSQPRRAQSTRPAEVLSASAYRPLPPAYSAPVTVAHAQAYSPTPVYTQQTTYAAPSTHGGYLTQEQYIQAYNSGYHYSQPAYVHPTPELAMARATAPRSPVQPAYTPPARRAAQPPIPELAPPRYQRGPNSPATQRPVAEVMMSRANGRHDRQEVQRALAPLAQPAQQQQPQPWVASPTTAMRAY